MAVVKVCKEAKICWKHPLTVDMFDGNDDELDLLQIIE